MDTADIHRMSQSEKMIAIETLWNSLITEENEIESPDWHGKILEERKNLLESGKAKYIPLKNLKRK